MKKLLSAAVAVCFAAATFGQAANGNAQPVSQSAANPNQPAAHQGAVQSNGPAPVSVMVREKAKKLTDQINRVVPLVQGLYEKVLNVNIEYQKKKEQVTGSVASNQLSPAQQAQIRQLRSERAKQLQATMGETSYGKWDSFVNKTTKNGTIQSTQVSED